MFTFPTWTGSCSITGRTLTRLSGSSFADGYPGIGLEVDIDPAVLSGIVVVLPDPPVTFKPNFRVWFIDADHLALEVDATYDLLIPAGTTAGSINSSTGVYTAPSSGSGPVIVTATANQDGTTADSVSLCVDARTAQTVDVDPGSYTPPSGWKLAGGAGKLLSGGLLGGANLERRLIIPG
jgi:hypothetical protein